MANTPDITVILGTRFAENWQLRSDVLKRLDKAVELYEKGEIKKILVSGKWTIWYDWLAIVPPVTEAQLMKDYLVSKGVSSSNITKETNSKDTIGNLYYLSRYLKTKPAYRMLLIICANQRAERIRFLVSKILGDRYDVSYCLVNAPDDKNSSLGVERDIRDSQENLLKEMKNGDTDALKYKLYNSSYYSDQARDVRSGKRKNELQ